VPRTYRGTVLAGDSPPANRQAFREWGKQPRVHAQQGCDGVGRSVEEVCLRKGQLWQE
jgi:hypothetical protein